MSSWQKKVKSSRVQRFKSSIRLLAKGSWQKESKKFKACLLDAVRQVKSKAQS
jgi:hypothetical protein